jgi:nitrate reductase gamma subunit
MTEAEFLLWVRGPALQAASVIFVLGLAARVLGILVIGRKADLAEARGSAVAGGLRTIVMRTFQDPGTWRRSSVTLVAGFIFHIGLLVTILFYAPHILVIEEVFGVSWPGLPTTVIDATTVVTIIAMIAVLVHRLRHPVIRFLSRFQDYLVWFVTILPLVTGYLAFHRIGLTPTMLIAVHILSVELLMVVFPFTKLTHAVTLFMARYYNGSISGYRGVKS